MSLEGIKFCDLCGAAIIPVDLAPVKLEEDGHLVQFHYHNRDENDCLAQKLVELTEKFVSERLETAVIQ
jgi:hypothetical protein